MKNYVYDTLSMGLVEIIGAYMKESGETGRRATHIAVSKVLETLLPFTKVEEDYDLYALKPLLRAVLLILTEREKKIKEACPSVDTSEYLRTTTFLQTLIERNTL